MSNHWLIASALLMVFLGQEVVYAAIVHGTIYDLSIQKVTSAVVEINTKPAQRIVTMNGSYSFEVPAGRYRLHAYYREGSTPLEAEENMTVVGDGTYVLDMFLYPDLSDDESLYSDLDFRIDQPNLQVKAFPWFWVLVPTLLLSILLLIRFRRHRSTPQQITQGERDITDVISLLRKNGGRMMQKEVRKELACSEAKISLIITEMESAGKLKRIKKGRGNLLVLIS